MLGAFVAIISGFGWALSRPAAAADALPYSIRTRSYTGYSSTVHGDIRTVGMAGATVGLADTFIAASDNPAGLAMTLDNADSNFTSNHIYDERIQSTATAITSNLLGVALSAYPWGFSLGYLSPEREDNTYQLPLPPQELARLDVAEREFRAALAHVFFDNRLSLGFSLNFAQAERAIEFAQSTSLNNAFHSYQLGTTLGAQLQLRPRLLLGLGWSSPIHYAGDEGTIPTPGVANFFQPVDVPGRLSLGVGWIPNRFARGDFTLAIVGGTPGAALLREQTLLTGSSTTVQPRLGLTYEFAEVADFHGSIYLGSYYETARIDGTTARLHGTAGIEIHPWVFTIGTGIDGAPSYTNYLVSIGVDVFKVMSKLDLIPHPWRPPYGGWFPSFDYFSDDGLARPLQSNWRPRGPDMNPIKVAKELPFKIEKKVVETSKAIVNAIQKEPEPKKGAKPRKRKRHGRKGAPEPRTEPSAPPMPLPVQPAPRAR